LTFNLLHLDTPSNWGDFDLVLCNPPFLSSSAGSGRATIEDTRCLVGGPTGLESYAAICSGIKECEKDKVPLLRAGGVVLFQTPGGTNGCTNTASVVQASGFEVVQALMDARGVQRCLVARSITRK